MSLQFCKRHFWFSFSCIINFLPFFLAMSNIFFDNVKRLKYKQHLQVSIPSLAFGKQVSHLFFLLLPRGLKLISDLFQKNLKLNCFFVFKMIITSPENLPINGNAQTCIVIVLIGKGLRIRTKTGLKLLGGSPLDDISYGRI